MKFQMSRQIFEKYQNIKFYKNISSGSRVVSCGQTNGQVDMNKLKVAFHNFAKQRKKKELLF
jgi:hypothetical protein